jgi:RNA polymerase sigma factor (sigma-70 family)
VIVVSQQDLIRLFRERSPRAHGLVLARCGDATVAEEITAQTFEAAAQQFARGRGEDAIDELGPRDEQLEDALGSLPTNQRSVIVLRYLDDWLVAEIAEGLDLTYRAVESLLARARRSLRSR